MVIQVTVRNREGLLLREEVESVRLPGVRGEFEVMSFHVPFVALLAPGRLWVGSRRLAIQGGLAWLRGNRLKVRVETRGEAG